MTAEELLKECYFIMTKINFLLEKTRLNREEAEEIVSYIEKIQKKVKEGFALTLNINLLYLLEELDEMLDKAKSLKADVATM